MAGHFGSDAVLLVVVLAAILLLLPLVLPDPLPPPPSLLLLVPVGMVLLLAFLAFAPSHNTFGNANFPQWIKTSIGTYLANRKHLSFVSFHSFTFASRSIKGEERRDDKNGNRLKDRFLLITCDYLLVLLHQILLPSILYLIVPLIGWVNYFPGREALGRTFALPMAKDQTQIYMWRGNKWEKGTKREAPVGSRMKCNSYPWSSCGGCDCSGGLCSGVKQ